MTIYFGADHAGFKLKQALIPFVEGLGHDVVDLGAYEFDPDDDYPDYVIPVARAVARNSETERGIILGGSGQGEAIAANRFAQVRAIVFNGQYAPKDGREVPLEVPLSREHNNANIISLGARFLSREEAQDAVRVWLETAFSGDERHVRRLAKIEALDASV